MKKLWYFLFLGVFVLYSCNKDEALTTEINAAQALEKDGSRENAKDTDAITAQVNNIIAFRDDVHWWRDNPQGRGMSAVEAIENTEIAFNIFLG